MDPGTIGLQNGAHQNFKKPRFIPVRMTAMKAARKRKERDAQANLQADTLFRDLATSWVAPCVSNTRNESSQCALT